MTPNTDKPKKLRNFSVSKNFNQVHTILESIDKQERSRFICEAIIEKNNNMNKEQKTTEPIEQMKQMMEQYQMITSFINPMQQPMPNPAVMQMMQQPAYQQPILDPVSLAQMQAQVFAQQVAQQVHTPVQPVQAAPSVEPVQAGPLQTVDKTELNQNEPVKDKTSPIEAGGESNFKPQYLFGEEPTSNEEEMHKETAAKSSPLPKGDARLQGRRRGGVTRQFM